MNQVIDDKMDAITRIASDQPHVYAFDIHGEVSEEDMRTMARIMNAAFERHDSVNMLLVFSNYEGQELGASLNVESLKAQFASLSNVDRYVVVGAPSAAETMIDVMGSILPIDTKTYELSQIDEAWAYAGARPLQGA